MTTTTSHAPWATIADALRTVRGVFTRLDAWLDARQRAFDDDLALAQLSDRDLHDIGLDRGFVSAVARGRWTRDDLDV